MSGSKTIIYSDLIFLDINNNVKYILSAKGEGVVPYPAYNYGFQNAGERLTKDLQNKITGGSGLNFNDDIANETARAKPSSQTSNNTIITQSQISNTTNPNDQESSSTQTNTIYPCPACENIVGTVLLNAPNVKGNGKCNLCNSRGQMKACVANPFGVQCRDARCIESDHRCTTCDGTNVCQRCMGRGIR